MDGWMDGWMDVGSRRRENESVIERNDVSRDNENRFFPPGTSAIVVLGGGGGGGIGGV